MILVATIAFLRNRRHCVLPRPEIHAVFKGSYDVRGRHMHLRCSGYRGDNGEHVRMRVCRCLAGRSFVSERCTYLCVVIVVVHEGRFFLKNGARHRTSNMRIKTACVGVRFSVTTVITMVVVIPRRVATVVTQSSCDSSNDRLNNAMILQKDLFKRNFTLLNVIHITQN